MAEDEMTLSRGVQNHWLLIFGVFLLSSCQAQPSLTIHINDEKYTANGFELSTHYDYLAPNPASFVLLANVLEERGYYDMTATNSSKPVRVIKIKYWEWFQGVGNPPSFTFAHDAIRAGPAPYNPPFNNHRVGITRWHYFYTGGTISGQNPSNAKQGSGGIWDYISTDENGNGPEATQQDGSASPTSIPLHSSGNGKITNRGRLLGYLKVRYDADWVKTTAGDYQVEWRSNRDVWSKTAGDISLVSGGGTGTPLATLLEIPWSASREAQPKDGP